MNSYLYLYSVSPGEIRYSGLSFGEFYRLLPRKFENMLLLKSEVLGTGCVNHFDVVEGSAEIARLIQELDRNPMGDFHFVDYAERGAVGKLTEAEIKNLLYLSHMWEPSGAPFFDTLQNRFAYLSHDGGWSCKLYLRDTNKFLAIAAGKIEALFAARTRAVLPPLDTETQDRLFENWEDGLWIDLRGLLGKRGPGVVKTYPIGKCDHMDAAISRWKPFAEKNPPAHCLSWDGAAWSLS